MTSVAQHQYDNTLNRDDDLEAPSTGAEMALPNRLSYSKAASVLMAALASPVLMWQFVDFSLMYGWLYFATFALGMIFLMWPVMAAESWLAGDRPISLRGLAQRVHLAGYAGRWVYVMPWLAGLVLFGLLVSIMHKTVITFAEIVAATQARLDIIGDANQLVTQHDQWLQGTINNMPLIGFCVVTIALILLMGVGRFAQSGSFRCIRVSWLLALAGLTFIATFSFSAIKSETWLQGIEWWLRPSITDWSFAILVAALKQLCLVAALGLGVWVTIRSRTGPVLPKTTPANVLVSSKRVKNIVVQKNYLNDNSNAAASSMKSTQAFADDDASVIDENGYDDVTGETVGFAGRSKRVSEYMFGRLAAILDTVNVKRRGSAVDVKGVDAQRAEGDKPNQQQITKSQKVLASASVSAPAKKAVVNRKLLSLKRQHFIALKKRWKVGFMVLAGYLAFAGVLAVLTSVIGVGMFSEFRLMVAEDAQVSRFIPYSVVGISDIGDANPAISGQLLQERQNAGVMNTDYPVLQYFAIAWLAAVLFLALSTLWALIEPFLKDGSQRRSRAAGLMALTSIFVFLGYLWPELVVWFDNILIPVGVPMCALMLLTVAVRRRQAQKFVDAQSFYKRGTASVGVNVESAQAKLVKMLPGERLVVYANAYLRYPLRILFIVVIAINSGLMSMVY